MKSRQILLRLSIGIIAFSCGVYVNEILINMAADGIHRATHSPVGGVKYISAPVEMRGAERLEILQDSEAYAVYSAVLREESSNGEALVIKSATGFEKYKVDYLNAEDDDWSKDTAEAIRDFAAKKDKVKALGNYFTGLDKIYLIDAIDEKQMFYYPDGWIKFARTYSGAEKLFELSPVGFNNERNRAIVTVSVECPVSCMSGKVVFLKKKDGKWINSYPIPSGSLLNSQ